MRAAVKADAADRPGVYRMLSADGEIVYVGKSKRVRSRLLSYFRCAYPEDKGARILREAIDARGTSFRDYVDAAGERGRFAERLAAYGRAGEPCRRCGTALEGTHAIDGRSTVLCPRCQR